jgi:serine/threonine protein kinase
MVEDTLATIPDGTKILDGKYAILKTLGEGAYSKVKLALDIKSGKLRAIKMHRGKLPAELKESICKEIEVLENIPHDNIVKLYHYGETAEVHKKRGDSMEFVENTHLIVVLEFAKGRDLISSLKVAGALNGSHALFYFKQFIGAIEHLHSYGISHRDIKPDNILFDKSMMLKLADFGMAGSVAVK